MPTYSAKELAMVYLMQVVLLVIWLIKFLKIDLKFKIVFLISVLKMDLLNHFNNKNVKLRLPLEYKIVFRHCNGAFAFCNFTIIVEGLEYHTLIENIAILYAL